MSRIGKYPIKIPSNVEVTLGPGTTVTVQGPKGSLDLDYKGHVEVKQAEGVLTVSRFSDARQDRAYHGLYQRLLRNMVLGVTEGFNRELELVGVGYRAQMDGSTLVLSLGYSHPIRYNPIEGVACQAPKPNQVIVTGIDKQKVGQAAAEIRGFRPPEPYKGKGVRYAGEQIRRKVGKTGV